MKTIEWYANLNNLEELLEEIRQEISKFKLSKMLDYQLNLACEEALVNIVNYGYKNSTGRVYVEINQSKPNVLEIKIIDEAMKFNPLSVPTPNLDVAIEERASKGLGIYIYRSVIDNIQYERKKEKNILTFVKNI